MNNQATTRLCKNCGQPVLATDAVCWHCNAKLSLPEPELANIAGESAQADDSPFLFQIFFYAALMIITAVALLLVTRSLGSQPRLINNPAAEGTPLVTLSAADGSFSIELPADWIWYFPQTDRGHGDGSAALAEDPRFQSALMPLGELAPDMQPVLLAQSESAILSVAKSERLGRFTVDNIVSSISSEAFPNSRVLESGAASTRLGLETAAITLEQRRPPLVCRQYFLRDPEIVYLASICGGLKQFEQNKLAAFEPILASLAVH